MGHNFQLKANDQLGVTLTWKEAESIPLSITSDIHPFMRAYCVVKDHPYVAVTDTTECFRSRICPPVNTASVSGTSVTGISIGLQGHRDSGAADGMPDVKIPVEKLKRP